jgi:hypothetical protein
MTKTIVISLIRKSLTVALLAVTLAAFGPVHEVRADAAAFGGTVSSARSVTPDSSACVPIAVPEPSSLALLAAGLAGLISMAVLRKKIRAR